MARLAAVFALLLACQGPPSTLHLGGGAGELDEDGGPGGTSAESPALILLIGDGMGRAQLDAASIYRYGERGLLTLQTLPIQAQVDTASLTGITDSAAAGTALATGVLTHNKKIAVDLEGAPVETLIELAHRQGLATGMVTTTTLAHATPATFAAHNRSRNNLDSIAVEIAGTTRPTVLLGGGRGQFRPEVESGAYSTVFPGYLFVDNPEDLQTHAGNADRLLGLFADEHLPYVLDRTDQHPPLPLMAQAALDHLAPSSTGFFLMIEGGRIDHAGHGNHIENIIAETLEFDDTVAAVLEWAEGRPNTTIVVTADHETGGLELLEDAEIGTVPEVAWRWGSHTNDRVQLFAVGPGTSFLQRETLDHRFVHGLFSAAIQGLAPRPPPLAILPNGEFSDLNEFASDEVVGPSTASLGGLFVGADQRGLGLGMEGLFPWQDHALVLLLDVNYGTNGGLPTLNLLQDEDGAADALLSGLAAGSTGEDGLAWDFAVLSLQGADPTSVQESENGGLRPLLVSFTKLPHVGVATNYSDGTRTRDTALPFEAGRGFETLIPWDLLGITDASAVAVRALLLESDGTVVAELNYRPD